MVSRLTRLFALLAITAYAQEDAGAADNQAQTEDSELSSKPRALEDYEPEYREWPALLEQYDLKIDKHHPLPISTQFIMEQIIDHDGRRYHTDSIMKGV